MIRGRVLDDEGKPIEGCVIPLTDNPQPERATSSRSGPVPSTFTGFRPKRGDDGTFAFEGMPEGVRCDLLAQERSSVHRRELSPDESKNVIILAGEGPIRGRVVDFLGNPVRNFRIKIGFPKKRKPGDEVGGYSSSLGNPGVTFTRRRRLHDPQPDGRERVSPDGPDRDARRRREPERPHGVARPVRRDQSTRGEALVEVCRLAPCDACDGRGRSRLPEDGGGPDQLSRVVGELRRPGGFHVTDGGGDALVGVAQQLSDVEGVATGQPVDGLGVGATPGLGE